MAEYDNLLAEAQAMLLDAEVGNASERNVTMARLTTALRALQTENTEPRERVKALRLVGATREDDLNTRLRNAERVITEAKKTYDLQCDTEPVRDDYMDEGAYRAHHWWWTVLGPVLSSYPLGEGQTQQGDER